MNMRRFLLAPLALFALVVAGLAGCGDDDESSAPVLTPTPAVVATPQATVVPPTTAERLASAALDESWGCGHGFWVGTDDQTIGLFLQFEDPTAASSGNVPPVGNVPSVIWSGEVRLGTDLFANWCDDVIEAGEPEAVVDETWTLIDGSITVIGTPPVNECGTLAVQLTDLVAESPSGETIELQDVTSRNPSWGCFAG